MSQAARVDYQTHPSQYRHWKLKFEGPVATLAADFDENAGLRPGYKLKLNSYDLGVDIELNDAVNRIRFEHPEVRTVVLTSAKDKVFCSGANIFMLGVSSHAWKVNFCKFTNETRNGLEDSSQHSGLKFLAAVNGACAGGGYELALACDEIILVDDRSSAVSLPEVPLLGVLPGTGGLTRVTDKRHVRHDLADIFCTSVEGVRGQRAKDWRLVDDIAKPALFAAKVQERALQLAEQSDRPAERQGRHPDAAAAHDRGRRAALLERDGRDRPRQAHRHLDREGPDRRAADRRRRHRGRRRRLVPAGAGARTGGRHPRDAHQRARDRHLADQDRRRRRRRAGDGRHAAGAQGPLAGARDDRPAAPHLQPLRRVRRAACSRSIEPGSCFAGSFLELALACDRSYQLALPDDEARAPKIALSRGQLRPVPDDHRPVAPAAPLLRRAAGAGRGAAPRSASRWTPTPPSRSAW